MNSKFLNVTRLPLIFLIILYPVFIIFFLAVARLNMPANQLPVASIRGIVAIFLVPLLTSFFLGYKEAKYHINLDQSLVYHTIFAFLETVILSITTSVFSINFSIYELVGFFIVFLFFHYFLGTIVVSIKLGSEIKNSRHFINLENKFKSDHFLERMGIFNLLALSILIVLLGIFFRVPQQAFLFIFFFALFLIALEFGSSTGNDVGIFLVLAIATLLSVYFYSIFTLILFFGFAMTLFTLKGQKHTKHAGHHFVNWIFSLIYFFTLVMIFGMALLLLDARYAIFSLMTPIQALFLFSFLLIISSIISYFLMLDISFHTVEYDPQHITWPLSLLVKPTGRLIRDSIIFGTLFGILLLLISSLSLLIIY
jgi:hypothetical protein